MPRKSLVQVGDIYGRLTVISKKAVKQWECICTCGRRTTVCSSSILRGDTRSCGCLRSEVLAADAADLTGQKFHLLTVISEANRKSPRVRRWACLCECGQIKIVNQPDLKSGNSRSCGCLQQEHRKKVSRFARKTQGGLSSHSLFTTWRNMMNRCYKSHDKNFKNYGARGITVCDRWHQFENFIADMGEKPFPKATIERKDNNGNYCPENCVWATRTIQTRNKRNTRKVQYQGEERSLAELAELAGVPLRNVRERIDRNGWDIERALTTPVAPSLRRKS